MMDSYTDPHGNERCENCNALMEDCACACVVCDDHVVECACEDGPAYPAVAEGD